MIGKRVGGYTHEWQIPNNLWQKYNWVHTNMGWKAKPIHTVPEFKTTATRANMNFYGRPIIKNYKNKYENARAKYKNIKAHPYPGEAWENELELAYYKMMNAGANMKAVGYAPGLLTANKIVRYNPKPNNNTPKDKPKPNNNTPKESALARRMKNALYFAELRVLEKLDTASKKTINFLKSQMNKSKARAKARINKILEEENKKIREENKLRKERSEISTREEKNLNKLRKERSEISTRGAKKLQNALKKKQEIRNKFRKVISNAQAENSKKIQEVKELAKNVHAQIKTRNSVNYNPFKTSRIKANLKANALKKQYIENQEEKMRKSIRSLLPKGTPYKERRSIGTIARNNTTTSGSVSRTPVR